MELVHEKKYLGDKISFDIKAPNHIKKLMNK